MSVRVKLEDVFHTRPFQKIAVVFLMLCLALVFPNLLHAQFLPPDTMEIDPSKTIYINDAAGEFTPGTGFQLVKSEYASLNISLYGMARWVNQTPAEDTWTDHRDSIRTFDGRNDIYWHRAMIWLRGHLATPKLTYMATVWTVTTTQQTLVYGSLNYNLNKNFTLGIGIVPNACIRSVQGSFPLFTSTDRTMGEEALRGGFTNGVFLSGEIAPKLKYMAALGNNLSILGVKASNLTRHFSKSLSVHWMPTTGEFGPRGGNGDIEHHEKPATRFGFSICHSRENRFNNVGQPSPDNTQVRLSDGVLFFETGALAPGLTVLEATYDMAALDLGFKYKGFALHTEFYYRTLTNINAGSIDPVTGAYEQGVSPIDKITDMGYTLQALYMLVPKKLCIYAVNSMLIDEFNRNPNEYGGGVNIYPEKTRSWRINAQVMSVFKSAGGGTFGLYTSGQTGTTITIGTDILL